MLRQYGVQRHRYETIRGRQVAVGTVPVGSIFRLEGAAGSRPRACMVEAWLPRAWPVCDRTGRVFFLGRGGHLALIRDLANGRRSRLADHIILRALGD